MAWISVHQSVFGHKLRGLKKRIGCSQSEALGILVTLWLWGLDNADKQGRILNASLEDVAALLSGQLSAKLKPRLVAEILLSECWIDEFSGDLFIHQWTEWQSYWLEYQERKEKDRQRKRSNNGNSTEYPQTFHGNSKEYPQNNHGESIENPQMFHGNSTEIPAQTDHTRTNHTETDLTETEQADGSPMQPGAPPAGPLPKSDAVPFAEIMRLYNEICASYPKIQIIDGQRKKAVAARFKTYGNIAVFGDLFRRMEESRFMKGENSRNWQADFDWVMMASNMAKTLEGKYDDKQRSQRPATSGGKPDTLSILASIVAEEEGVIRE